MARPNNRPVRKTPTRRMGDTTKLRLSEIRSPPSESAPTQLDTDSVGRAEADFINHLRADSTIGSGLPGKTDLRFQHIVSPSTHERIRKARGRLKHDPVNPLVEIPLAVGVCFTTIHSCGCGAYE